MKRFTLLAAFIICFLSDIRVSSADTRVALIIGNGAYKNAPSLANPRNDAEDVAAALKRGGFETIVGYDLDKAAMEDAEVRFARAARAADVAVFYYSGHALQFAGVNYLAPIDLALADEADLRRMVRLDELVADVQQAKNLRILILDACRDNPLADQLKRSVGATRASPLQRGLAKIDAPQGMIVAYSTQAGRTASDGDGRNSPYTTAFLKHIEEQVEIGTVFRRISADVYEATKHDQLPELSLSLIGEFYLRGKADLLISNGAANLDTVKQDFAAAQSVDTVGAWNAFSANHPNGYYADLAKEQRSRLEAKLSATSQPTSTGSSASAALLETAGLFSPQAKIMTISGQMNFVVKGYNIMPRVGTEWSPEKTSKSDLQRTFKVENGKIYLQAVDDKFSLECALDRDNKRIYSGITTDYNVEQSCRLNREGNFYTINSTVRMWNDNRKNVKTDNVDTFFARILATGAGCKLIDFTFDRKNGQESVGGPRWQSHFTGSGSVRTEQSCQMIDGVN